MAFSSVPKPQGQGQPSPEVQPRQPRGRTDMTPDDDDIQDYMRPWVGLTDEEVSEIIDAEIGFNSCWGPEETFARAIEAKLKEKNT